MNEELKKYRIILKLSKEQIYSFIPLLPEAIAEDVVNQVEKEDKYKLGTREYHRLYYQKNKKKMNKYKKLWIAENKEKHLEYQRKYHRRGKNVI